MPTLIQTDPPLPARDVLPTMYDLPSELIGDTGMPDEYHLLQATLLNETFRPPVISPTEVFSAADLNLYYDVRHTSWYKRPDWFGVTGVPRLYEGRDSRLSYVIWQEGVAPLIVVELLSPGTEKEDLGQRLRDTNEPPTKWEVYERILRVPYYAIFGRDANQLRIFQLSGMRYVEVTGHAGRFWIAEAELGLGLWQGTYQAQERLWLRWFDAQGNWLPTSDERATQQQKEKEAALLREAQLRQRAEQAEQTAEMERQRADRLAELLRQLGQDPDQF